MDRRTFLKQVGYASLGWMLFQSLPEVWAEPVPRAFRQKKLVVVLLRGAADGLSVLIPANDPHYYDLRPHIAVAEPGKAGGALALNQRYALHPALSDILPLWKAGQMAFIPCTGSPDSTRSHFDAQDYMESGTPGVKITPDGWMNRLLQQLPASHNTMQATNFGTTIPKILLGKASVANVALSQNGGKRTQVIDRPGVRNVFDGLYSGRDPLSHAYQEGITTRETVREQEAEATNPNDPEQKMANNGALFARQFSQNAKQVANLIRPVDGVQLAFLGVGGWDTHVNQGNGTGQLARNLTQLSQTLSGLLSGLGPTFKDTVIVVMSEFGRTVKENGNSGTDHGHGNVMWVLGGGIHGGKVIGDYPPLVAQHLFEGRDLPVQTDFRSVLCGVAQHHLGLSVGQLGAVFPGFSGQTGPVKTLFS